MTTGMRILAIEDDAATADAFRAVLEDDGHEVRVAGDGRKALAELASFQPDVVILDLMLPALSGHALLRYLRELPEYRRIPILVVSGAVPTLQRLDDVQGVLRKPFELTELLSLIGQVRASVRARLN